MTEPGLHVNRPEKDQANKGARGVFVRRMQRNVNRLVCPEHQTHPKLVILPDGRYKVTDICCEKLQALVQGALEQKKADR